MSLGYDVVSVKQMLLSVDITSSTIKKFNAINIIKPSVSRRKERKGKLFEEDFTSVVCNTLLSYNLMRERFISFARDKRLVHLILSVRYLLQERYGVHLPEIENLIVWHSFASIGDEKILFKCADISTVEYPNDL